MTQFWASIVLASLALTQSAGAADLRQVVPPGRFLATCEDLGTFRVADACGRDQIEAAQACRLQCPSAVVLGVAPAACRIPDPQAVIVPRRPG